MIRIDPDGKATVYGAELVTDEHSTPCGVLVWLDFGRKNYKLLLKIEDAVYLRDMLNEIEEIK